jgi:hypothetical protein
MKNEDKSAIQETLEFLTTAFNIDGKCTFHSYISDGLKFRLEDSKKGVFYISIQHALPLYRDSILDDLFGLIDSSRVLSDKLSGSIITKDFSNNLAYLATLIETFAEDTYL